MHNIDQACAVTALAQTTKVPVPIVVQVMTGYFTYVVLLEELAAQRLSPWEVMAIFQFSAAISMF